MKVCSTAILYFDENNVPKMKAYADGITGWDGCYRCQRCLALEPRRNPGDMFCVNAAHILVIHSEMNKGQWRVDPVIAATWFDLICQCRGLGSIIMTLPVGALSKMPEVEKLLRVTEGRFYNIIMGFGYPDVEFARGVQREGIASVNELTF